MSVTYVFSQVSPRVASGEGRGVTKKGLSGNTFVIKCSATLALFSAALHFLLLTLYPQDTQSRWGGQERSASQANAKELLIQDGH